MRLLRGANSVFYDKLDVNVTGIVIELKLKEVQGVPMC